MDRIVKGHGCYYICSYGDWNQDRLLQYRQFPTRPVVYLCLPGASAVMSPQPQP